MDEEHLRDLLGDLGPLGFRRMFGGIGVYAHGAMFALASSDGELYVKGDDVTEPILREAGCRLLTRTEKDGRVRAMRYWRVPDAAQDDPGEAACLGRLGMEAAGRAALLKRPKPKRAGDLRRSTPKG